MYLKINCLYGLYGLVLLSAVWPKVSGSELFGVLYLAFACNDSEGESTITLSCINKTEQPSVILVREVTVYSKLRAENNGSNHCQIHSEDCVLGQVSSNDIKRKCTGQAECKAQMAARTTRGNSCSTEYMDSAGYMILNYYCVLVENIIAMNPANVITRTADTIFLSNRGLLKDNSTIPAEDICPSCQLTMNTNSGTMIIHTIHLDLGRDGQDSCKQRIIVDDGGEIKMFTCDDSQNYTISTVYTTRGSIISVTLENTLGVNSGRFWLAFQGVGGEITATCSSQNCSVPSKLKTFKAPPGPCETAEGRKSVCYGSARESVMDAKCTDANDVLVVKSVNVGTKPASYNCPREIADSINARLNERRCCQPNIQEDCILNYTRPAFYHLCAGKTTCRPTNAVWMDIGDKCDQNRFHPQTSYMFLDYCCKARHSIIEMGRTNTIIGTSGMLWNRGYSKNINQSDPEISCSVSAMYSNGPIFVYAVHLTLERDTHTRECKQWLRFQNSDGTAATLGCDDSSGYSIQHVYTSTGNHMTTTLINNLTEPKGNIWLYFRLQGDADNLQISCPPASTPISSSESTTANSKPFQDGTEPDDITTSSSGNRFTTSSSTTTLNQRESDDVQSIYYMTGSSAGVLVLVVIAAVIIIVKSLHGKSRPQRMTPGENDSYKEPIHCSNTIPSGSYMSLNSTSSGYSMGIEDGCQVMYDNNVIFKRAYRGNLMEDDPLPSKCPDYISPIAGSSEGSAYISFCSPDSNGSELY